MCKIYSILNDDGQLRNKKEYPIFILVHQTPAVIENMAEIREIINQDQDRHLADLLLGHGLNVHAVGRSRDPLIRDQGKKS